MVLIMTVYIFFTGVRADGTTKVRPVDDMSISGINGATHVLEKESYDSLDLLFETLQLLAEESSVSSLHAHPFITLYTSPLLCDMQSGAIGAGKSGY